MREHQDFIQKLKWALYEWIGTISVHELAVNRELATRIERLCRCLHKVA
jgi:hypothetical protein